MIFHVLNGALSKLLEYHMAVHSFHYFRFHRVILGVKPMKFFLVF